MDDFYDRVVNKIENKKNTLQVEVPMEDYKKSTYTQRKVSCPNVAIGEQQGQFKIYDKAFYIS